MKVVKPKSLGRPPLPDEDRRVVLSVRVSKGLLNELADGVDLGKRSQFVEQAIRRELKRQSARA